MVSCHLWRRSRALERRGFAASSNNACWCQRLLAAVFKPPAAWLVPSLLNFIRDLWFSLDCNPLTLQLRRLQTSSDSLQAESKVWQMRSKSCYEGVQEHRTQMCTMWKKAWSMAPWVSNVDCWAPKAWHAEFWKGKLHCTLPLDIFDIFLCLVQDWTRKKEMM